MAAVGSQDFRRSPTVKSSVAYFLFIHTQILATHVTLCNKYHICINFVLTGGMCQQSSEMVGVYIYVQPQMGGRAQPTATLCHPPYWMVE